MSRYGADSQSLRSALSPFSLSLAEKHPEQELSQVTEPPSNSSASRTLLLTSSGNSTLSVLSSLSLPLPFSSFHSPLLVVSNPSGVRLTSSPLLSLELVSSPFGSCGSESASTPWFLSTYVIPFFDSYMLTFSSSRTEVSGLVSLSLFASTWVRF